MSAPTPFDSGSDADGETTQAVKETALAMLEDGRFHLPFPTTWIEDPFEIDPMGEHRNYYLACEKSPSQNGGKFGDLEQLIRRRYPPFRKPEGAELAPVL